MLKVKVGESVKLKEELESIFISFSYSPETVAKIKTLPVRQYEPKNKTWEAPAKDLHKVISLFPDTPINLTGKAHTGAVEFTAPDTTDFNYKTKPFQHQIEGFNYGLENNKFLLGDEQGLGKTKQAIDLAVACKSQFKHCLIITGVNGLKYNWMNEIALHSNEGSFLLGSTVNAKGKLKEGSVACRLAHLNNLDEIDSYFLVTNIETLRYKKVKKDENGKAVKFRGKTVYTYPVAEKLEKLTSDGTIGMVVIDEIHKCKNAQTDQGKAIHRIKSSRKVALTGTPLMNKPIDLYSILKWLDVESRSFYAFRSRYCRMGGFGGKEIIGYQNLGELQSRLDAVMLRRKKDQVLNLPPKIRSTEFVEMTAKQRQLYNEVRNSIEANLEEIVLSPNPLAQLTRLRQVTSSPAVISSITESAKIERLKEIIEELADTGKKAVIYSNWTEMVNLMAKELHKYKPAIITGQVKDRQAEVNKFQEDSSCKVIIGTIGAMGTGLTLTAASSVIFLDKPWNMANTEQAEDRAHRIGTTGTVNIVTLVCEGTIDEHIEEIILSKANYADALVDGKVDKISKQELLAKLLS